MHVSVVLDCADPDRLAAFWTAALGYEEVARDGPFIGLRARDGSRPTLVLQRVPEPKAGKNRMHLDVFADDFDADRRRLEGLGATTLVPPHAEEDGMTLTVMADPEGNEFCLLARPPSAEGSTS
jgi:catechol 2,3-dioxygenase-like lactoylglutathione lyase family enzyme